ncbi:TRAP transporter large permease subunit [Tissierella creatinophila]|uniref:Sialic acid TRAP transporter permease protein SiaT n=1 Tax=Tissierella creatinophila DSM 6911 TaxID=1123403 RepID=A0A1U7M7D2_TISCR|nr:TRAP transporter large permease subunit [Tissierella creatinophila]OLS03207.1 sialic acid TRAP transporter permease protein SiaT [Tissierella creatinophila DSM 6911]
MAGIPMELLYLFALLITIVVVFVLLKRPIYEAMFVGYVVMILILGKWDKFIYYLIQPSTNTLFYAIVAFMSLAFIFGQTNVVDAIINFVLSIVGRFKGGAGYVSLVASTFMAALSGTGPGNVAATGVFTIPAMIKTGFPSELAATVEMSASSLGPMIPPSGTILLAFAALDTVFPGKYELSTFWMAVWGVGIWFILQRFITLYIFCRKYKVSPVPKDEIPKIGETLKNGWKALLVPLIIFIPLYLDFKFKDTFFVSRLGEEGAKAFSASVILFTPGVAAIYSLLISKDEINGGLSFKNIFDLFKRGIQHITPVAATVYFAYSISTLFGDANVGASLGEYVESFNMTKLQLIIFFPIFTTFLGMILPGSSQVAIFGTGIVASLATVGVNPLLVAAILPAITGALEGMTPPLALAMYTAMGIAGSKMKETSALALIWVFAHLVLAIILLSGILPIPFIQ